MQKCMESSTEMCRLFRDAVLELAKRHAFARTLVNSGRLSVPVTLHGSALNTADCDAFEGRMRPGAPAADAPVRLADGSASWLLRQLADASFTALVFDAGEEQIAELRGAAQGIVPLCVVQITPIGAARPGAFTDSEGLIAQRYDMRPGTTYLLRPDQHVCARWRGPSAAAVNAALRRATARA